MNRVNKYRNAILLNDVFENCVATMALLDEN